MAMIDTKNETRHGNGTVGGQWTSLVIWTDMPNPNQQTDDELLERAKHLAGQISDPRVVTILSALLIAEAIRFGSGRIT
jgi:hypothetical protein